MPSYNPLNSGNGTNLQGSVENKGLFNRLLRNLSNWGQKTDDMIVRNQIGVGINEDPLSQKNNSMYDAMSSKAVARILGKKAIPYLDKAYADKRRILREYSIKDEIRDCISVVSDECIIYNGNDFCAPKPLSNNYSDEIKDKYQEYFEKLYNKFGFSDTITAWNYMKDFLIDGFLALEIIWDDKKQNIISFNRMRPDSLMPAYEPSIGNLWIQFPEDPQLRRIFLDSQLVFISYTSQNDFSETSYVEGLIKPYNQLKILEQSKIMFNVINTTLYQKFTIPTNGLSRQKAEEAIGQMIANYHEQVDWDETLGTLSINGSKHLPYNKQLWLPKSELGEPNMELISPQGTDLNEDVTLKYFIAAFRRATHIPVLRFSMETGGGMVFTLDAPDVNQDEQKFANFTNRIRANFKEIIVKPLKLQMCMEFPELKDDEIFLNEIDIIFSTNQTIEQWKKIRAFQKKIECAKSMAEFLNVEGTPYFHPDFIVKEIIKLTTEEINENNAFWLKSKAAGKIIAPPTEGGGSPGSEFVGGGGGSMPAPEMGGENNIPAQGQAPAQGNEEGEETEEKTEFEF